MATTAIDHQFGFLIRYAILAPSARNSQPWLFTIHGNTVHLRADLERWLPVADRERRELHLSLGCALENLLVAAECVGYRSEVAYFPDPDDLDLTAVVTFDPAEDLVPAPTATLETLQLRHTPHRPFMARPITPRLLDRLRGIRGEPGVRLSLCDAGDRRRSAEVLNVRALVQLFGDEAYREEMGRAMGNGSWIASQAGRLVLTHFDPGRRLAHQASALLRSAPIVGVIGSMEDGPEDQVRSGRVLERLWLAATAEGLALQPMSYALEVPALRAELAALFPEAGARAQQLVRVGYAAARDASGTPRRALDDVVSAGEHRRAAHAT